MLYGKLIRDILRFIYLIMAPACVLSIVFGTFGFISSIVHPRDPLRDKITASASKFENPNQGQLGGWRPLPLFNGYLFIASKPIFKGEVIQADSLERESWEFEGSASNGMKFSNQVVVHSVAAKDIAKDQLITPADLVPAVLKQESTANPDATVKTASDDTHMPAIWGPSAFLLLVAGFCVYAYGVLSLHVLAFQKSLVWGLSSVFVPFAAALFKLTNWGCSRRLFHVTLVGCCLMSFAVAMIFIDFRPPLRW